MNSTLFPLPPRVGSTLPWHRLPPFSLNLTHPLGRQMNAWVFGPHADASSMSAALHLDGTSASYFSYMVASMVTIAIFALLGSLGGVWSARRLIRVLAYFFLLPPIAASTVLATASLLNTVPVGVLLLVIEVSLGWSLGAIGMLILSLPIPRQEVVSNLSRHRPVTDSGYVAHSVLALMEILRTLCVSNVLMIFGRVAFLFVLPCLASGSLKFAFVWLDLAVALILVDRHVVTRVIYASDRWLFRHGESEW